MLISAFLSITDFIVSLLPLNLPSSGVDFEETILFLKGYLDNVISFIYAYVISYEVVKSIFTLLLIWISAKIAYKLFWFCMRKMPIPVRE